MLGWADSESRARSACRSVMIQLMDSTRSGLVSKMCFIAAWPISRTSVSSSCHDIGGSWFAGKKRHFAEEIAFVQSRNCARRAAGQISERDAAVVNDKHRRAFVAGAYHSLARGKYVTNSRLRELPQSRRATGVQKYRLLKAIGNLIFGSDRTSRRLRVQVQAFGLGMRKFNPARRKAYQIL